MSPIPMRSLVRGFKPYTAGLSIDEIREKYGIERVIKLASNENPLGTSPLVQHTLETHVGLAFRYPQAGNPRLVKAIAAHHGVSPSRIIVGDGSDEVIDLLFRICVEPGVNNAVAFMPCFGIYTTQAALCGVELRQTPVNADFSFPWDNLLKLVTTRRRSCSSPRPTTRPGTRLRWRNSKRWRRRCPTPACSCWTKPTWTSPTTRRITRWRSGWTNSPM